MEPDPARGRPARGWGSLARSRPVFSGPSLAPDTDARPLPSPPSPPGPSRAAAPLSPPPLRGRRKGEKSPNIPLFSRLTPWRRGPICRPELPGPGTPGSLEMKVTQGPHGSAPFSPALLRCARCERVSPGPRPTPAACGPRSWAAAGGCPPGAEPGLPRTLNPPTLGTPGPPGLRQARLYRPGGQRGRPGTGYPLPSPPRKRTVFPGKNPVPIPVLPAGGCRAPRAPPRVPRCRSSEAAAGGGRGAGPRPGERGGAR